MNREDLGIYDAYDSCNVKCENAEFLQPRLLQFKTNYYHEQDAIEQMKILKRTIEYFDKEVNA